MRHTIPLWVWPVVLALVVGAVAAVVAIRLSTRPDPFRGEAEFYCSMRADIPSVTSPEFDECVRAQLKRAHGA